MEVPSLKQIAAHAFAKAASEIDPFELVNALKSFPKEYHFYLKRVISEMPWQGLITLVQSGKFKNFISSDTLNNAIEFEEHHLRQQFQLNPDHNELVNNTIGLYNVFGTNAFGNNSEIFKFREWGYNFFDNVPSTNEKQDEREQEEKRGVMFEGFGVKKQTYLEAATAVKRKEETEEFEYEKTLYFDLENCLPQWGVQNNTQTMCETFPQADNRTKKDGILWSILWQPGTRFDDKAAKMQQDGRKPLCLFLKVHNSQTPCSIKEYHDCPTLQKFWSCKLKSIHIAVSHSGDTASNGTHHQQGQRNIGETKMANINLLPALRYAQEFDELYPEGLKGQEGPERPEQQPDQQPVVPPSSAISDGENSPSASSYTQEEIEEALSMGNQTLSVSNESATLSELSMHNFNVDRGFKTFLSYEHAQRLVDPATGTLRIAVTITRERPTKITSKNSMCVDCSSTTDLCSCSNSYFGNSHTPGPSMATCVDTPDSAASSINLSDDFVCDAASEAPSSPDSSSSDAEGSDASQKKEQKKNSKKKIVFFSEGNVPSRKLKGQPSITTSIQEFKKNFNVFTSNALVEMDWSNVLCGGGCCTACLFPVDVGANRVSFFSPQKSWQSQSWRDNFNNEKQQKQLDKAYDTKQKLAYSKRSTSHKSVSCSDAVVYVYMVCSSDFSPCFATFS